MNKKSLAKKISSKFGIPNSISVKIIEFIFSEISECISDGEETNIVGFGKFYPYTHASRPVRNPKTQERMRLNEYTTVRFKISQKLKNKLKKG